MLRVVRISGASDVWQSACAFPLEVRLQSGLTATVYANLSDALKKKHTHTPLADGNTSSSTHIFCLNSHALKDFSEAEVNRCSVFHLDQSGARGFASKCC